VRARAKELKGPGLKKTQGRKLRARAATDEGPNSHHLQLWKRLKSTVHQDKLTAKLGGRKAKAATCESPDSHHIRNVTNEHGPMNKRTNPRRAGDDAQGWSCPRNPSLDTYPGKLSDACDQENPRIFIFFKMNTNPFFCFFWRNTESFVSVCADLRYVYGTNIS